MNINRFTHEVDSEFLCSVCNLVIVQPMRAPCDHECCAACLPTLVEKSRLLTVTCPLCAVDFEPQEAVSALKTGRLLAKLEIICDHAERGCTWRGPWGNLMTHRTEQCDYEVVKCPYSIAGCPLTMERHQIPEHKPHCDYRTEQCRSCLGLFKHVDLALHVQRCDLVVEPCSLKCGATVTRAAKYRHVEEDCPNALVACPMHSFGCSVKLQRGLLQAHLQENVHQHLAVLVSTIQRERIQQTELIGTLQTQLAAQPQADLSLSNGNSIADTLQQLQQTVLEQQSTIDRFLRGSVITVDPRGVGQFRTIESALRVAVSGDTIVLRAGVYNESVTVSTPHLWIRGASASDVTINGMMNSAVKITAVDVKISHAFLTSSSRHAATVRIQVEVPSGSSSERKETPDSTGNTNISSTTAATAVSVLTDHSRTHSCEDSPPALLEDCIVEAKYLGCVCVASGPCILRRCHVRNSKHFGVEWATKSKSNLIESCVVEGHEHPNVVVTERGQVLLRSSSLVNSALNGLWVRGGDAIAEHCTISNNSYSNVDIVGNTGKCRLVKCDIQGSKKCGVCVAEGKAEIVQCNIATNALPNVAVLALASCVSEKNKIHTGETHGVVVKELGKFISCQDRIENNADINIAVEQGAVFEKDTATSDRNLLR